MLFRTLILEQVAQSAFYQVYWGHADHMGEAIEKMRANALDNGLTNPTIREADPFDPQRLTPELAARANDEVFWTGRIYFPEDPTGSKVFPTGIVSAWVKGPHKPEDIRAGLCVFRNDNGLVNIEVNVPGPLLRPLYYELLRQWDEFRVFWYKIHAHWLPERNAEIALEPLRPEPDDALYVNRDLNTPDKVIDHIDANRADSIDNGYVTVTAYVGEGDTNLNISDHKKLIVLTYSDAVAERVLAFLRERGYEKVDPFLTIDSEMHHWHYRPSGSRDRATLIAHLEAEGFTPWQPQPRPE